MRKFVLGGLLLFAGCAGTESGAPTAQTGGDPSFDGRYVGTVLSVSPAACGQAGRAVTITLANGALSMPISGASVVGRVNPNGSFSNVRFTNPNFSSSGSGQITSGRILLNLSTSNPAFTVPCSFSYEARKRE